MIVAAVLAAGAVLTPSGKWQVSYEPTTCLLSHAYGADGTTALSLKSYALDPLSRGVAVTVISGANGDSNFRRGIAKVFMGEGAPLSATYDSGVTPDRARHVIRFYLDSDGFKAITRAAEVRIVAGPDQIAFVPGFTPGVVAALATCTHDLWRRWKVDPDESIQVAEPAVPLTKRETWIVGDDYPASAIEAGTSGKGLMVWTIGTDGRVADCRIVSTSGSKALDDMACASLTLRARYRPAIGKDGRPIATHDLALVHWESLR